MRRKSNAFVIASEEEYGELKEKVKRILTDNPETDYCGLLMRLVDDGQYVTVRKIQGSNRIRSFIAYVIRHRHKKAGDGNDDLRERFHDLHA